MKKIITIFLCIECLCECYSQVQYLTLDSLANNKPVTYFDCGYSEKCWNLNSCLQLKCDSLYKLRDTTFVEYGLKSSFRGYQITSSISLQTACKGGSVIKMDTFALLYAIYIAKENESEYLNLMIDSLYRDLIAKKDELQANPDFYRNNYFLYHKGDFLFFNHSSYSLIHFNGFFIKVMNKGLNDNNGALGKAFMNQICRFRGDDYETYFDEKDTPIIHPLDFIIWYESGKFKK